MPIHAWSQFTTTEFESLNRAKTLVLLPSGALEQHGPHLPVGTDCQCVEELMRRVAPHIQDLDVIVLPTIWCTKSDEHVGFLGSLYLRAETMLALYHDLAAAVRASGFKRLVLLNWHGGNTDLLSVLVRDLHLRAGLLTFLIDFITVYAGSAVQPTADDRADLHAGRAETSLMLAAYPDLVKPGPYDHIGSDLTHGPVASSFGGSKLLVPEGGPIRIGWSTAELSRDGVIGDPTKANRAEGEQLWGTMAGHVAEMLREIANFEFRTETGTE